MKYSKNNILVGISCLAILTFWQSVDLAAFENLDEMIRRKARYSTNPWPETLLEDKNKNYVWQPETLCYQDITTGKEVWALVHAPDLQDMYSKEPNTNAWSFDGSRVGFFSNRERPTENTAAGKHLLWIVNTDGSGLKACEGYGKNDIPQNGFSWAYTENAYYTFGSGGEEGDTFKLYKNIVNNSNVITGVVVLDTSSVNNLKKEIVSDGVSTDDSHVVFRDLKSRTLPTPNPVDCSAVYFATLKPPAVLNYWWGIARHIGPSKNNWADPYGNQLPSSEVNFHGVSSPGPTGSWIIGTYSGAAVFVILKSNGSAGDGGPLWQDWKKGSFGNDEIKVISNGSGLPNNPYGNPYFGHPAWDRWGKYAIIGTYTESPAPGSRIYNNDKNSLEANYPLWYNKYDGQHHSWTGWTDYVVAVSPDWPSGDSKRYFIFANKWNGTYSKAFQVVNTHLNYVRNYNAYPRPSQSPDGTKVAFAASFLNNDPDRYPSIFYAVVYYPYPPVKITVSKADPNLRISWTRPSYTTRGWPNENIDPPPKAREIKGYHVWVSDNGHTGWTEITGSAVSTEYYDIIQANSTTKYYAITSEEYSRLESKKLSAVLQVDLDGSRNLSSKQFADEGITSFWTKPPSAPTGCNIVKTEYGNRLTWIEPSDTKIRYYNIYYASGKEPGIYQQCRIASLPIGTNAYLDWLADKTDTAYYRITSVDRLGNESRADAIQMVK